MKTVTITDAQKHLLILFYDLHVGLKPILITDEEDKAVLITEAHYVRLKKIEKFLWETYKNIEGSMWDESPMSDTEQRIDSFVDAL